MAGEVLHLAEHSPTFSVLQVVEQLLVVPGSVVLVRSDNQDIFLCPRVRGKGEEPSIGRERPLYLSCPDVFFKKDLVVVARDD